jgi:hypothetical protein
MVSVLIVGYSIAIIVAGIIFAVGQGLQYDPFVAFLLLIAGAVGSIIGAATMATLVQGLFSDLDNVAGRVSDVRYGDVFSRNITRFAVIIAPIATSYGLLRIIQFLQ